MTPFVVFLKKQSVSLSPINGMFRVLGDITKSAEELDIPDPVRSAQNKRHDVVLVPAAFDRAPTHRVGTTELLANGQCLYFTVGVLALCSLDARSTCPVERCLVVLI